jgi:hypothetical protein
MPNATIQRELMGVWTFRSAVRGWVQIGGRWGWVLQAWPGGFQSGEQESQDLHRVEPRVQLGFKEEHVEELG